jgi:hypothetical protein
MDASAMMNLYYILKPIYLPVAFSLRAKQIKAVILAPLGVKLLCRAFLLAGSLAPGLNFELNMIYATCVAQHLGNSLTRNKTLSAMYF